MLTIEFTLWMFIAIVFYTYLGFPLLLVVRGVRPRTIAKSPSTPFVSVVIIAHNESKVIADKIENMLSLDYPADQMEILIGSDGSDDGTHEIVQGYENRGVRLLVSPRQGKILTLNATVKKARGEILVFSDANSMLAPESVREMTACFSDANVGAVAGDQRYDRDSGNAASQGERAFWSFDRFLKTMQSRSGNATSSTGAIHAIRARLFHPVPSGVSDDFIISTRTIAQGYRLVFEPNAIAYEEVAPTDQAEFKRKSRVIARGIRALWEMRCLLNPFQHGFYSFQLASHKLLRWSVVFILPIILVLTALLFSESWVYMTLFVTQVVFYSIALLVFAIRGSRLFQFRLVRFLAIPYFFCLGNLAALCGWAQFVSGQRVDIWNSKRMTTQAT